MADGFHVTAFCHTCQKFLCDCVKHLGRASITAALIISFSHAASSFIVPPAWGADHPHPDQQQDTRQPRESLKTSGATASTVIHRGILHPKQAFHAEAVDRTGKVTVLELDANGISITSPER